MESTATQLGPNNRPTRTSLRGSIRIVAKIDHQLIVKMVTAAYPQVHRQVEPFKLAPAPPVGK